MKNVTRTLTFLLAFLLTATLGMAQTVYETVGIIGSATARGWDASTPMTAGTGANNHQWTVTLPLTAGGEAKFRANNAWDVNWGATTFPAGMGVANGPNIPVTTAGTYTVTFNDVTGAYQFTPATPTSNRSQNAAILNLAVAPNPAREAVKVVYELPTAGTAAISVLNVLGQPVRQFTAVRQGAGLQEQRVSVQDLAAGVYLVRLEAGNKTQTARLLVD